MKKLRWLYESCIYLLALLFLYTALSKLFDMKHFIKAINRQPFSEGLKPILIVTVPLIEIAAAFMLLRLKSRFGGLLLSAILMLAFTIYVAMAVFHVFAKVPCGCAGVFQAMSWNEHLLFNIIFLLFAFTGLRLHRNYRTNDLSLERQVR